MRPYFGAVFVGVVAAGLFSCTRRDALLVPDAQTLAMPVGKPAAEIDGPDLDGAPLKLSDHQGKVVVLVCYAHY